MSDGTDTPLAEDARLTVPGGDYITAARLARERKCSRATVHNAIERAELTGIVELGEVTLIPFALAAAWRPRSRGGQRKKPADE